MKAVWFGATWIVLLGLSLAFWYGIYALIMGAIA